jgi:hypothetical protein
MANTAHPKGRAADAWTTCPPLKWTRCWFQTHRAAHGPSCMAPCAMEWKRMALACGAHIETIDGYLIAFTEARP